MKFRPCIDLHDGKVKQIVGSTLDTESLRTNFVSDRDPEWYANLYRRDGLDGGHVILLGSGNESAARRALAAWPGGLQLGGGITGGNAAEWLEAGAAKVIVTSFVFRDGMIDFERLAELERSVGREHLTLDLSCRARDGQYYVVTDRWRKFTNSALSRPLLETLAGHCSEFLVHAVDVEGKQGGIDPALMALLSENSPIGCVYAGGVANFGDVDRIDEIGKGRIDFTIGSALDIFGGPLSYSLLLKKLKGR